MTQEVRVKLQLTLDVDATFSKEQIKQKLMDNLVYIKDPFNQENFDIEMKDIVEIREEAEIYGTEEDSPEMKAYYDKYKIDRKRQTKLEF